MVAKGQKLDFEVETFVTHTLRGEGFGASEDGTGRGTPIVPVAFAQNQRDELRTMDVAGALAAEPGMKQQTYIAFTAQDHGADAMDDLSPTLRAGGHSASHANAGVMPAVTVAPTLRAGGNSTGGDRPPGTDADTSDSLLTVGTAAVRRLTPRECERLQGFPDNYTAIPYRRKPADQCPDGPRYKALGNSMAVPVIRWIGQRIENVEQNSRARPNRCEANA